MSAQVSLSSQFPAFAKHINPDYSIFFRMPRKFFQALLCTNAAYIADHFPESPFFTFEGLVEDLHQQHGVRKSQIFAAYIKMDRFGLLSDGAPNLEDTNCDLVLYTDHCGKVGEASTRIYLHKNVVLELGELVAANVQPQLYN